jgi:hypothetical protein
MTTMIERLLARMTAYGEDLETKLNRGANIDIEPSAFATVGADASVATLMAAAAADNAARAAARLRALHEPASARDAIHGSAGVAKPPKVIDAEFVEIATEEKPDDAT